MTDLDRSVFHQLFSLSKCQTAATSPDLSATEPVPRLSERILRRKTAGMPMVGVVVIPDLAVVVVVVVVVVVAAAAGQAVVNIESINKYSYLKCF
jgi:hypothetical protein